MYIAVAEEEEHHFLSQAVLNGTACILYVLLSTLGFNPTSMTTIT